MSASADIISYFKASGIHIVLYMTSSPGWYWYECLTRAEVIRRTELRYAFSEVNWLLSKQRDEKRIKSDSTEPTLYLNYLFD